MAEAKAEDERLVGDAQRQSHEMLADARQRADKIDSDARAHAERVTSEANEQAAQVNRDAEARRAELLSTLESERDQFAAKVDHLRDFESRFRGNFMSSLEEYLAKLRSATIEPDDVPTLMSAEDRSASATPRLDALLSKGRTASSTRPKTPDCVAFVV